MHLIRLCLVMTAALFVSDIAHGQDTLYVDDTAPVGGDGLSWNSAYCDLQDALDAASASGGTVAEIHVGRGQYFPTRRTEIADVRSATFSLIDGLAVRGGYAGHGAIDPDLRNPDAFVTRLTGLGVFYHVVRANGTGPGTILDGFYVSEGQADGGALFTPRGRRHTHRGRRTDTAGVFHRT